MTALAWILLLAAVNRVELVNEDYQIAAADWQWVPLGIKQRSGMLLANYRVMGQGTARLVLMRRQDIEDMPHGALAQAGPARFGALGRYISELGDYSLVVDNTEGKIPANVHLSVWIDFSQKGPPVETLPPERQLVVIILSFAVFFAIVSWSARRLLRAVRRE